MRYNVPTSRTFHNRIARNLGVLVAAAAVLLLSTAAQAQTPGKPEIGIATSCGYRCGTAIGDVEVRMLGSGLDTMAIVYWQVNYTDASGDQRTAVVDRRQDAADEAVGLDSDREGLWKAMYRGCSEDMYQP